jgi:hypothetical protein
MMPSALANRFPRVVAAIGGVMLAALGAFALIAPRSFFETVARFEPYNQHFIQDIGAFQIGLGVVLLLAAVPAYADALAVALLGNPGPVDHERRPARGRLAPHVGRVVESDRWRATELDVFGRTLGDLVDRELFARGREGPAMAEWVAHHAVALAPEHLANRQLRFGASGDSPLREGIHIVDLE